MDLAFFEDVIKVDCTVVDPYAIIAFGHGVVDDASAAHIILYQDDL
jgi:hypothetical protein